jgi:UDP-N-acetylglucosamine 2-epimerase (hydrolysing)
VVIAPNNDPGTEQIFATLEKLPHDRFRLIPSMRFNYFSELMKNAALMLGNSSAGVREAPFLGLPSLDVGTRQNNRAQASSVSSFSAFDTDDIRQWIDGKWMHRELANNGFGHGAASSLFIEILEKPEFWQSNMQKSFE